MTHTPPIPAGNQSPYPLQEPPHKPATPAPPAGDPRVARTPEKHEMPQVSTLVGITAGIGLAAIAGGLLYAFRSQPPRKRKKAKRKTAAS